MTSLPKTLITGEMKVQLGKVTETRVSYPVSASDIRKWAIAVYWPEKPPRIFWDEVFARNTPFGGVIAPEDFNPFAWPVEMRQSMMEAQSTKPGQRVLNGGSEAWYYKPIRPGDVIRAEINLADLYERTGPKLGLMLFTVREQRWTNQSGELVKILRTTSITY